LKHKDKWRILIDKHEVEERVPGKQGLKLEELRKRGYEFRVEERVPGKQGLKLPKRSL